MLFLLAQNTNLMRRLTILFIFFLLANTGFSQIPYNERYSSSVFNEIEVFQDVIYGNAPALSFPYLNENNTTPQDMLMDIYSPVGDTLNYRPVLVCAHSGAFVSGTKSAEDMVAFCDSMAHRGYVTASIDYRLGMNVFSSESSTRAVYRGVQDGRSAIRFLKENALYYGIDTNNIYMLGSSAGAYVGLHNLYMDTEDERPPETYINPDLGCLDCSGNSYQHSGKANGLIALWGALQDTSLIISIDTIPVFLAHGTADATVPFGYGSAFGNPAFPATYGSDLIAEQIENFGNDVEKYFVSGEGHEFYGTDNGDWPGTPNNYWDTVFNSTVSFTYDIHKPIAGFYYNDYGLYEFYDQSISATSWYWDFGDGTYSTEQNPVHEYIDYGDYRVTQFVKSDLISWDTLSMEVYFWLGTEEMKDIEVKVYPNPSHEKVTFMNKGESKIYLTLMNTLGNVVYSTEIEGKSSTSLNVYDYNPGVYFAVTESKNNKAINKLIIN